MLRFLHTDNEDVWAYLSQFTDWHPYEHRVLAAIGEHLVPLPFNLNSLHQVFPAEKARQLENSLLSRYGAGARVPILELLGSEDRELKNLADFIFENIFLNYTSKQWGRRPEEISREVTARVPIHISRDDRYFQDHHQALPARGYSAMVSAMLGHDSIETRTNTAMKSVLKFNMETMDLDYKGELFDGPVVYTGMLDELYENRYGALPYRSLQFEFEHFEQAEFQPAATVNYPSHPDMTRITEFKHLQSEKTLGTTIVREYPQDFDPSDPTKNIPYYPVFSEENSARHRRYMQLAARFKNLLVLGRLGDYRYYDMDDAVAAALKAFQNYSSTAGISPAK